MKASLVFKNGVVYTADAGRTIAEAVAVVDGKIAYVGDNAGVQAYVSAETEVVDLAGKMLLPSFFEGHAHYTKATSTVVGINLAGLDTEADYVAAMKQFLAERPGLQGLARARKRWMRFPRKFRLWCRQKHCILCGATPKPLSWRELRRTRQTRKTVGLSAILTAAPTVVFGKLPKI